MLPFSAVFGRSCLLSRETLTLNLAHTKLDRSTRSFSHTLVLLRYAVLCPLLSQTAIGGRAQQIKYFTPLTASALSQLAVRYTMSSGSNQPPHTSSDEYAASREDLELFRRLLRVARLIKANDIDNLGGYPNILIAFIR